MANPHIPDPLKIPPKTGEYLVVVYWAYEWNTPDYSKQNKSRTKNNIRHGSLVKVIKQGSNANGNSFIVAPVDGYGWVDLYSGYMARLFIKRVEIEDGSNKTSAA
jgi:hypothetical protein